VGSASAWPAPWGRESDGCRGGDWATASLHVLDAWMKTWFARTRLCCIHGAELGWGMPFVGGNLVLSSWRSRPVVAMERECCGKKCHRSQGKVRPACPTEASSAAACRR
jgi:hypothetical protein